MSHHSHWLHYTSSELSGYERLKVDLAQTSFFEGREFHFIDEFSIAQGATKVLQIVAPVDTVVYDISYAIDAGHLRASLVIGGTPGGTFNGTVHSHPANNMTPGGDNRRIYMAPATPYEQQVTVTSGGTHTGGTEVEIVRLLVAGNSNFANSFGSAPGLEHGMAPDTYYLRLQNIGSGTCTGVVKARWEERP